MNVSSAASRRLAVWQNAAIEKVIPRTSRVTSFFLKPDRPFPYQAGQHVSVRLTAPDGYRAQRNYSIATSPERGDDIELAIERLDRGEVSGYFHEIAMAGDEIEIHFLNVLVINKEVVCPDGCVCGLSSPVGH